MSSADQQKTYRSELMSCAFYANWSRPDIAFTLSKLAKFMQNPGPKHQAALKRLLRYLGATSSRGLTYSFSGRPAKTGVYGYYDAAFADDIDTRRSTMGYVMFFEGCVISWHSKLHTYVTTSSNHSEYCAAAKCARESKFLQMLMRSFYTVRRRRPFLLPKTITAAPGSHRGQTPKCPLMSH